MKILLLLVITMILLVDGSYGVSVCPLQEGSAAMVFREAGHPLIGTWAAFLGTYPPCGARAHHAGVYLWAWRLYCVKYNSTWFLYYFGVGQQWWSLRLGGGAGLTASKLLQVFQVTIRTCRISWYYSKYSKKLLGHVEYHDTTPRSVIDPTNHIWSYIYKINIWGPHVNHIRTPR